MTRWFERLFHWFGMVAHAQMFPEKRTIDYHNGQRQTPTLVVLETIRGGGEGGGLCFLWVKSNVPSTIPP